MHYYSALRVQPYSHSEFSDPKEVPLLALLCSLTGLEGSGGSSWQAGTQWDLETGLSDASAGETLSPD